MGKRYNQDLNNIVFLGDLVDVVRKTRDYRDKYQNCFYQLEEDESLDEDQIALQARLTMKRYADQIKKDIFQLPDIEQFKASFQGQIELLYLPKKANFPLGDDRGLSFEMRKFQHIKERVDTLTGAYEEFLEGFTQTFIELDQGAVLDQLSFSDAQEVCDILDSALRHFLDDFPPVLTKSDRMLLSDIITRPSGGLEH